MLALEIVKYAYLATLVCVILVELFPTRRIARPAALAAIFLVSVGGSAWAYAAYYTPGSWPEFEYDKQAAADGGHSRSSNRGTSSGGGGDPEEAAGAAGEGDLDDTGGAAGGGSSASAASAGAAAGNAAARTTEQTARRVAQALGLMAEPEPKPGAGDSIKDCSDCPEMVIVPAGRARIGAADDDSQASAAERPARDVRVWPGFAIGKAVIDHQDYRRFLDESRRTASACAQEFASLDTVIDQEQLCISPRDAEAFAIWLSNRIGKTYRLATAAEWEYAMRVLPEGVLKRGEAAEIVADCWQERLPREGYDIFGAGGREVECQTRMMKSAAPGEEQRWHRLSARRPIAANAARPQTSLRLVRDLDR